jgi:hypothetical protein
MEYIFDRPWELGLTLAIVLALVLDLGRRLAARLDFEGIPQRKEQMGTIRDGMFVLVSLLLGFSLTLAASRFSERRTLLVDEVTSLGTTYLRASTLLGPYRDHSRQLLREYVETRLGMDGGGLNPDHYSATLSQSKHLQEELWLDATAAAGGDRTAITNGYLSTLTETIDLHEKRVASFENRVPMPIWILIIFVSLVAVFTRGATLTSRFWLTLMLVPITIAIAVALIADLDSPTHGFKHLDQRAMERLKSEMSSEH